MTRDPRSRDSAFATPLKGLILTFAAVTTLLAVSSVLTLRITTAGIAVVATVGLLWAWHVALGGAYARAAAQAFAIVSVAMVAFLWVGNGTRDYGMTGVPALIFAGCVFLSARAYWAQAAFLTLGVTVIGVAELMGVRAVKGPPVELASLINLWVMLAGTAIGGRVLMRGVQAAFAREAALSGKLEQTAERLERIFRSSQDAIVISSLRDGTYVEVNDAYLTLFGYAREEVIGQSALKLGVWEDPRERERFVRVLSTTRRVREFEARLKRKNGDVMEVLLSGELQDIDGTPCIVISTADITARRRAERRAEYLMTRDAMTGLPNRALALDRLRRLIDSSSGDPRWVAVLHVGLDRFKRINEAGSRGAGDAILRETAERLGRLAGERGTLARVGGDEFVLILPIEAGLRSVEALAGEVLRVIDEPYSVGSQVFRLNASVGISLYPNDANDAEKLLHCADTAMRAAKDEMRGGYRLFEQIMGERLRDRLRIESRLRESIGGPTLSLVYQPKFDIATRALTGMEVLSRWRHPELGEVAPTTFIGIAEESALITELGDWVIDSACAQLAEWRRAGLANAPLAINLSARQLHSRLPGQLAARTAHHGVAPGLIELEVTETVLISRPEAARRVLEQIAHNGNRVLLDDFGVGYSSLSYVKQLHINGIKIDRSFVEDIAESRHDRAIVSAIAGLAHGLGLRVVAEGVESADQLGVLRELGCDEVQGFHLCRPQPADVIAREYLQRGPAAAALPPAAATTLH
ncbi:MAG: EAL domain-containing protein [Betaproteobacteria bacterium]|nr:EAL domain-containing protein [Betaproteobacteria bacterium]